MVDIGLRSTVPETLLVVGQPTAMLQRTSTQETARGLRPADALALPVLPPLTPVSSRRLVVLQNQPTTLAAALPLHQGRIRVESTAKHHAALTRQPTRHALTPPAHQGQTRSTVGLHVARLPPSTIQEPNAIRALRDPILALLATPTEPAPTIATARHLQELTRLAQFLLQGISDARLVLTTLGPALKAEGESPLKSVLLRSSRARRRVAGTRRYSQELRQTLRSLLASILAAKKAVIAPHPNPKTDPERALATDPTLETKVMKTTTVIAVLRPRLKKVAIAAHQLGLNRVTVADPTPRPTTGETLTTGVKISAAHHPSVAPRPPDENLLRDTTPKSVVQAVPTPDLPALDLLPTSARTPTAALKTTSHATQEGTTTPENSAPNGPKITPRAPDPLVPTPELRPSMPRLPNPQAPVSPRPHSQPSRNSSTPTTPAGNP